MGEKCILLAEDNPAHVDLLCRALQTCDVACRVDVVHDGVEAIDYLFGTGQRPAHEPPTMPDLILLDLKMPRMDGLQVLKVLRRVRGDDRRHFPPVVVLTSSDLEQDVAEAYKWGAQSYISKPLVYEEFALAVREAVHYWLGLNRPMPQQRQLCMAGHES